MGSKKKQQKKQKRSKQKDELITEYCISARINLGEDNLWQQLWKSYKWFNASLGVAWINKVNDSQTSRNQDILKKNGLGEQDIQTQEKTSVQASPVKKSIRRAGPARDPNIQPE